MGKKALITPGDRFGYLRVLRELPARRWNGGTTRVFECKCDCGGTKTITASNLKSGATTSCGCYGARRRQENNDAKRIRVSAGDVYGRMTILHEGEVAATKRGTADRMVQCRCVCGIEKSVSLRALRQGGTVSCGCYRRSREARGASITHGMKGTPTYYVWATMKARCNPANAAKRSRYAGRGITVCKRWQAFENFLTDMGVRPSDNHSLDRIDNDGNYCKSNCRWSLPLEQANNKSNTKWIDLNGVSKPQMEWCRELGISKSMFVYRLRRWSHDRILTTKGHAYAKSRAKASQV